LFIFLSLAWVLSFLWSFLAGFYKAALTLQMPLKEGIGGESSSNRERVKIG
jgi:hypothetical protein